MSEPAVKSIGTTPKVLFFLVALLPTAVTMLSVGRVSDESKVWVFAVNAAIAYVGSFGLLRDPKHHIAVTAVAAAVLASFFWVFDTFAGVLGGCACGSSGGFM